MVMMTMSIRYGRIRKVCRTSKKRALWSNLSRRLIHIHAANLRAIVETPLLTVTDRAASRLHLVERSRGLHMVDELTRLERWVDMKLIRTRG